MQTHIQISSFKSDDTWSILNEIELSIKQKVEKAGIPLKNWDVEMYRGVLTGFNDAFIITSDKREEILSNCADDSERDRTAELIRPIVSTGCSSSPLVLSDNTVEVPAAPFY